jgi:hypothetical protein
MARVRIEFHHPTRAAIYLDHVRAVHDDLVHGRVTFEHRGGATSYDGDELAGWGIEDDEEDEEGTDG